AGVRLELRQLVDVPAAAKRFHQQHAGVHAPAHDVDLIAFTRLAQVQTNKYSQWNLLWLWQIQRMWNAVSETRLYTMLHERLPDTCIVSTGPSPKPRAVSCTATTALTRPDR